MKNLVDNQRVDLWLVLACLAVHSVKYGMTDNERASERERESCMHEKLPLYHELAHTVARDTQMPKSQGEDSRKEARL